MNRKRTSTSVAGLTTVLLASPAIAQPAPAPPAAEGPAPPVEVRVRGTGGTTARGIGDVHLDRETIEASPRQQTSEMLSAAPGFFVDHEDGEGLGNDVYLRGFDLDHGSGIEMRLGAIPINVPTHIQGQGYADANFIIPEVVRSIHVLEGSYDPHQGDAAIVGSASFDLGVRERGYELKTTYGSFGNARVVGIAAPDDADDATFAAFALRRTDGFGQNRAAQSASANAQFALNLTERDRVRLVATAYDASARLAGVVREDDVNAGRIGYYDSYPTGPGYFAGSQSIESARVVAGAELEHLTARGSRVVVSPWFMWTNYRARQNYTGDLESSQIDPSLSGKGDLFELANRESAGGLSASFRSAPFSFGPGSDVQIEPGTYVRVGHTDQAKSLLDPNDTLAVWDRRIDAGLDTFDVGGYVDAGLRFHDAFRLAGSVRADLLQVTVDDHLAGVTRGASVRGVGGVAAGPRLTASYALDDQVTASVSYGEGFRSLDVSNLQIGGAPFSKIRSVESGVRLRTRDDRYATSVAIFDTWVQNELVFEAESGGLETEHASVRSGVVSSFVAKPWAWLLASSALSVTRATFDTLVPGVGHLVPNLPPILFRTDVAAHARLGVLGGKPVVGRLGAGYTFLAPRHLTDAIVGAPNHVLNVKVAARWTWLEVGVDAYNVLALKYADDAEYYVSNWSTQPGQQRASPAVHLTVAPPLTVLASVSLYF